MPIVFLPEVTKLYYPEHQCHIHDLKSQLKPTVVSECYCLVCVSFVSIAAVVVLCYGHLTTASPVAYSHLKLNVLSFLFGRIIHVHAMVLCSDVN